jgi:DNA-directed RNA polymerase II subunit RPB1
MNIMMFVDYDLQKGLPQPAILKPKPLWTGKQVISLVIPDQVNYESSPVFKAFTDDTAVTIHGGEVLSGVVNKRTVGNTAGGLIHIVWKDNGPLAARDLLSNIQFVVNNWLVNTGFTVGV